MSGTAGRSPKGLRPLRVVGWVCWFVAGSRIRALALSPYRINTIFLVAVNSPACIRQK